MKIFISWSGKRSKHIAAALRDWIPNVIQAADPWMSDKDIETGRPWFQEISQQLEQCKAGIICVTPENQDRHWLNFEAGALAKQFSESFACPYLHGLTPTQLDGPMSQLQARNADKDGTK